MSCDATRISENASPRAAEFTLIFESSSMMRTSKPAPSIPEVLAELRVDAGERRKRLLPVLVVERAERLVGVRPDRDLPGA